MNKQLEKVGFFLYRSSFALLIFLLISFSAVMPIDSIAQASESENNAFNTFIVVGALVVFVLLCITILVGRVIYNRSCLLDIPRRYLPVTPADLPHEESREFILESMERSKDLNVLFNIPIYPVIHPGLEPPERSASTNAEKIFPSYLDYKSAMKTISKKFKYTGTFLSLPDVGVNIDDTITDFVYSTYVKDNLENVEQINNAKKFIQIYEHCIFSGEDVTREQFLEFVQLCIYFTDNNNISWSDVDELGSMTTALEKDTNSVLNIHPNTENNINNNHQREEMGGNHINNDIDTAAEDIEYFPSESYLRNENSTGSVARLTQSHISNPSIDNNTNISSDQLSNMNDVASVMHR